MHPVVGREREEIFFISYFIFTGLGPVIVLKKLDFALNQTDRASQFCFLGYLP
jgi:hypothetical protein